MWRFFKDFCLYGLVGFIGKIAAIFLLPVYTNILTREEYGAMTLIFTCSGVIELVSNLNIHSGIARDYYEDNIDRTRLISTGFFSILILSIFILINMLLTRQFWMGRVLSLDNCYDIAFVLMLLSIPTASLQSYFAILTRFKKKALLFSIGALIGLAIRIGVAVLCIVVLRTGIMGIFLGELLAQVFCTLFYAYANKEFIAFTYEKEYIKRALLFSLPTLPAILAGWLDTSAGQIMIGKNISLTDLGVYSIAISITSVFTFLSTAFQNVWYPYLYENYKLDSFRFQIRKIFTVFMIALIAISVILSLFSKEIILLLSNDGYIAATKYVTILCVPMVLYLIFPFGGSGISIARDTKHIGFAYIFGSVANLSILFFAIGKFGVITVPICLALSRLTSYFYLYIMSSKHIRFQLPNYLIFAFLIIMAALYFIDSWNLSLFMRAAVACAFVIPLTVWAWVKFGIRNMLSTIINRKRVC